MAPIVTVKQLVTHVLNNPKHYPGLHHTPQPRTSRGASLLDTHRQMLLIWDAMCAYCRERLTEGRAVHIPKLGTMTAEPIRLSNNERQVIYPRPCFVPVPALRKALFRSSSKSEGVEAQPGGNCYNARGNTVYLNYVPIAAGTYFKSDVVKSALEAMFTAVNDLVDREYNLALDFCFAKMNITRRQLNMQFSREFTDVETTIQRQKIRKSQSLPKLSNTWRQPAFSKSMKNFMERPNSREYSRMRLSTDNLRIMSMDLNSFCARKG